MDANFSPIRLCLLAVLLGGFAALGGFSPPSDPHLTRAWLRCVGIFMVGALSSTLVDHRVGDFDPVSLRPAYVLLGLFLMGAGLLWIRSMKSASPYEGIPSSELRT